MQSTNVREINEAIDLQTFRGTRTVQAPDGSRVIRARKVKGQLQAKLLGGTWINVETISIN